MLPVLCLGCGQRISLSERPFCALCQMSLKRVGYGSCPLCHSLLEDGVCQNCSEIDFSFAFSRSVYEYDNAAKDAVHQLKYNGLKPIARFIAEGMYKALADFPEFEYFDYVASVPLHRVRKRERGFNQSELIARHFASLSGKSYLNCLKRKRYTKSQTNLSQKERLRNVRDVFGATTDVSGKSIIVIDDVFTTGSTLNEACQSLLNAKAAKVAGYTACRA